MTCTHARLQVLRTVVLHRHMLFPNSHAICAVYSQMDPKFLRNQVIHTRSLACRATGLSQYQHELV